jgi:hypothetical protein
MAGVVGEVRGTTRQKTYLKYRSQTKDYSEWSCSPDPWDEDECFNSMRQDLKTGEWVLSFRFHS